MDYKAYLQGEHWKLMRRLRREVDNEQCAVCGSSDKLNVHHKTYERIGAERLGDLITLCHQCHGKYHDKLGNVGSIIPQKSTVETFHKQDNLSNFEIDEEYSVLTVTNNTYDNYDLILEGKKLGTIPNQRKVKINQIPSGIREFIFKSGEKEKKKIENVKESLSLDIEYSKEELENFVKELRNTNFKKPLTIENQNILNKTLEIKDIIPELEDVGFINYYFQYPEVLELLVSKGYDLNKQSKYNQTPMEYWAQTSAVGNEENYFFLLNNGAIPTKKTLEYALSKASKKIIYSVLTYVDFEPDFIYEVVRNKNEGVLELLLKNGVDINHTRPNYENVIYYFIRNKRWDVIDKLVAAGIDKKSSTNRNESAFLLALRNGVSEEKALRMLDLGFSPLGLDISDFSPLFYACSQNYLSLIKRLLSEYNLNINQVNKEGATPLMYACSNPRLDVIKFLLENGADLKALDRNNLTALDRSIQQKNISVAKLLIEHGSDVNTINYLGNTPLVTAVLNKNSDLVKLLLDNGADKTIKTSRDILQLAKDLKLIEIVELLK